MSRNVGFLFSLFLYLITLTLNGQYTLINHFSTSNGLPTNTVYCIEVDDTGFVWFGTDLGLTRFDGIDFINYNPQDGLPDVDILNFFKDSSGRIWLYTFNGKVTYLEDGKVYSSENHQGLKGKDFNSRITFIQEWNGTIIIGSLFDGFIVLNPELEVQYAEVPEKIEPTTTFIYIFGDVLFKFSQGVDKSIVESINMRDLLDGKKPKRKGLSSMTGQFSYFTDIDKFIIGLSRAFDQSIVILNTADNMIHMVTGNQPYANNVGKIDKQILVCTVRGIRTFDPISEKVTNFPISPEVDFRNTTSIKEVQNQTWVTSFDGVFLLTKSNVKRQFQAEVSAAAKLAAQGDSILHLVYDQQSLGSIKNLKLSFQNKLSKNSKLRAMEVDSLGRLLILSHSQLYLGNGEVRRLYGNRMLKNSKIISPSIQDDHLFIEDLIKNEKFVVEGWANKSRIISFEFLADSILIIADQKDVFLVDLGAKEVAETPSIFKGLKVKAFEKDEFGCLWIATYNNGLLRIKVDELEDLLVSDSSLVSEYKVLSGSYSKLLFVDTVLYAAQASGLDRVVFDAQTINSVVNIGDVDGLENARINDLDNMGGQIFVAQENGLYAFDHQHSFERTASYPVVIDEVTTSETLLRNYSDNQVYQFRYDVGLIHIKCKALDFSANGNFEYSFKLRDEDAWTPTESNIVSFANLSPDEYSFQFRAKTKNGPWSEPALLNFTVLPSFWQTIWFRALIILSSISLIAWLSAFYTRNKERRDRLMKDKMISDLRALKAQINPHFLFNSLNSINSFILDSDTDLAESYLTKYGKLMRKILNHSDQLSVSFYDEKEAILLYVELEKLRLPGSFNFKLDLDQSIDYESLRIPSMIVQPLLENAIWHGIQPSGKKGTIVLRVSKVGELVNIFIQDNGVGFSNTSPSLLPHGLNLVKERISILNKIEGVSAFFDVKSDTTGTTVKFSYPISLD